MPLYWNLNKPQTNSMYLKKISIAIILLLVSANTWSQNIDINILKSINSPNPGSKFWLATSNSIYWAPATVSVTTLGTGFINHDKTAKRNGVELLISAGISQLFSETLKNTFNRTRPADKYPGEIFVSSPVHGKSFPSGHTSLAFATATTLALQYKKWYITVPSFLWAGFVGYARMYMGKHFPSDVLAGIIVGIASGFISHSITKKIYTQ